MPRSPNQQQKAATPLAGTGGSAGTTPAQTAIEYQQHRSSYESKYTPTKSEIGTTPTSQLGSSNPSEMASAWGLPPNVGALQLPTGTVVTKPATGHDQSNIQRGIAMLDIYGKLRTGKKLSRADLKAAQQLGGPVARAAELVGITAGSGRGKPQETPGVTNLGLIGDVPLKTIPPGTELTGKGHPKKVTKPPKSPTGENASFKHPSEPQEGTKHSKEVQGAVTDAEKELEQRLHTTLGLTPTELSGASLDNRAPSRIVGIMQNAGYGVTSKMTLEKVLDIASGSGPTSTPSTTVSTPITVAQYIQNLTNGKMSKTQIFSLQQSLFQGGFYGESYDSGQSKITPGQLTSGTVLAFRSAILQTLTQKEQGKKVTLNGVIGGSTSGNILSAADLTTPAAKGKTAIEYATPQQMQGTLESAMETYLGRLPTSQELNEFAHYYDQLQQTGNKTLTEEGENPSGLGYVTYQTGVPYMPKVPTPSQAAEQWTQTQDPTTFKAQKVANAYGMLMNLIDRSSTSALDTVGTRPTTTT